VPHDQNPNHPPANTSAVDRGSNPLEIKHRTNRGFVVPYVELAVPKGIGTNHEHLPVAQINCGPGPNPDLKQYGLRDWLKKEPHLAHVAVEGSPAPLRL